LPSKAETEYSQSHVKQELNFGVTTIFPPWLRDDDAPLASGVYSLGVPLANTLPDAAFEQSK